MNAGGVNKYHLSMLKGLYAQESVSCRLLPVCHDCDLLVEKRIQKR
jgi:hypothetical protein